MVSGTFCKAHRHMGMGFGNRVLPGNDHRCVYCDAPCDGRLYGVSNNTSQECEAAAHMRKRAAERPCVEGCIGQPGHNDDCWPRKKEGV